MQNKLLQTNQLQTNYILFTRKRKVKFSMKFDLLVEVNLLLHENEFILYCDVSGIVFPQVRKKTGFEF